MEKTSSRRRFCIDNEAHCVGAHAICETLSQWEKLGWKNWQFSTNISLRLVKPN